MELFFLDEYKCVSSFSIVLCMQVSTCVCTRVCTCVSSCLLPHCTMMVRMLAALTHTQRHRKWPEDQLLNFFVAVFMSRLVSHEPVACLSWSKGKRVSFQYAPKPGATNEVDISTRPVALIQEWRATKRIKINMALSLYLSNTSSMRMGKCRGSSTHSWPRWVVSCMLRPLGQGCSLDDGPNEDESPLSPSKSRVVLLTCPSHKNKLFCVLSDVTDKFQPSVYTYL